MNRQFMDLYDRELTHLRTMGAEFARQFPKIAGRLGGLDEFQPCRDPFIERLLEGFAFLATRVQFKLESEFPRFSQSLLQTVYPHFLSPTPSVGMIQFQPDLDEGGLAEGFVIPRGSSLFSRLGKKEQTRCEYRMAHDVTLWPIEIVEAEYLTRELASLGIPDLPGTQAGIRLRLRCTAGLKFQELKMDSLVFHILGMGEIPMHLYEQLLGHSIGMVVQSTAKPVKWQKVVEQPGIARVGFETDQQLLPYGARSFQGYRLLNEYFMVPGRFMFVEIGNLGLYTRGYAGNELDVVILLDKLNTNLESAVNADNFALFCTPAINLFEKRADRIHVSDRSSEFHIVPDRTRPKDFEVYEVLRVTGYGTQAELTREFLPFYLARDRSDSSSQAYYVTNRVARLQSEHDRLRGPRSGSYSGSEVYLSVVDTAAAPYSPDIKQLGVETLCTNRDLPLHLSIGQGGSDFTMDKAAPCSGICCLGSVTSPKASPTAGAITWRAINHLSLNYLSLTDTDDGSGVSALRDILGLYADVGDLQISKQIEGVKAVQCKPITRRIRMSGSIAFARGLEVKVTLEEAMFAGSGVFLMGAVLEQFFARYVSINSFTETVIETVERGEIMRWPMRTGLRQIL